MFKRLQWRWTRRSIYWLAGILVFLICVRLALPFVLKTFINHQLNKSADYGGKISDVTVHLWRGAYQIHDINIFKKNGDVPVPLFSSHLMDLSLQWSELFHGALVSKIIMQQPHLNFVSGPTKQQTQTGTENNWADMLNGLVPFKINSLQVTNGQVHFKNPYSKPAVDIYLTDIFGIATNFTNTRDLTNPLPAGVIVNAKALGGGKLDINAHINPLAKTPTFELTSQLTNVNLVALNDFLRAYGKFDVERGDFALFTSFAAKDGKYDGYCKVFFNDLNVFEWEKERKKNALEVFWEAIVGTAATIFKNQPKDQLATKIPISGTLKSTDVHIWPTIETLLRNAFIKALVPKLDQPVKIQKVENQTDQKSDKQ